MGTHSKFFRVAAEGGTTDGRTIAREWIEQMAKNFNRNLHAPRVWLEHIRGILPDSSFKAYGDVTALKTEEADLGDGKTRLILLAQIEPLPELLAMNKKKQKLFTSCEIAPSFADTGEAYLMGLAVTDSPASLGTEVLQFAANAQNSPFASRKHDPNNLFSEPFEQTGFLDGVELSTENQSQPAQAMPQAQFYNAQHMLPAQAMPQAQFYNAQPMQPAQAMPQAQFYNAQPMQPAQAMPQAQFYNAQPMQPAQAVPQAQFYNAQPMQPAQMMPAHYTAQPMQQAMQQPVHYTAQPQSMPTPQDQMFNELKQATDALKAMSTELSAAFSSLAEQTSVQSVEQYSTRKPVSGRPVDFGGNVIDC